jgi:arsenite methyltransferase
MKDEDLRKAVTDKYAQAAIAAKSGGKSSCCETTCCGGESRGADPITGNLYEAPQTSGLPPEAVSASLGCGNPTALARLNPGDVVLDLGSGGGMRGGWGPPERPTAST